MNRVLGQSLTQIRGWFDQRVQPQPIGLVAHEAAHATVALALGLDVTELQIWNERGTWRGECAWSDAYATTEERMTILAAGAASVDFLHPTIATGGWWGAQDDLTAMSRLRPGITASEREAYRSQARRMLEDNRDTFERLSTGLLQRNGEMDAAQIRAIATPGMMPRQGVDISRWTDAQRHRFASKVEEMVRTNRVPAHIARQIDALSKTRPASITAPTYRIGKTVIETRVGGPIMEVR